MISDRMEWIGKIKDVARDIVFVVIVIPLLLIEYLLGISYDNSTQRNAEKWNEHKKIK